MLLQKEVSHLDENEIGKYIGKCNQENIMWDFLTVDESLNLMARVKGLTRQERDHNKRVIMDTLELTYFKNTLATNLSGGNKRKLCCAMSLIMCPRVEFLDEPTTGVDPVSRRALVRMVKRMKQSSVLLTTHRMDEAEQLCDKIAIMINGRFVVFGTPSYLKTNYGLGYSITLSQTREKFADPNTNIKHLMKNALPTATIEFDGSTNAIDNPEHEGGLPTVELRYTV